jgi:hypothetical protein
VLLVRLRRGNFALAGSSQKDEKQPFCTDIWSIMLSCATDIIIGQGNSTK